MFRWQEGGRDAADTIAKILGDPYYLLGKRLDAPYVVAKRSTWVKVLKPADSQKQDRHEVFERNAKPHVSSAV